MSEFGKAKRMAAAMAAPASAALVRRPGSIRRTSHIDMLLAEGRDLELVGSARDLVTLASSAATTEATTDATTVGAARVHADVGPDGALARLSIEPATGDAAALIGRTVGAGFRDAVHAAFGADVASATPLALLLDDLPVAALISGYARLYLGEIPADSAAQSMKSDICSGWRAEGTMMASVRAGLGVPVTLGPSAPAVAEEVASDPLGWHEIPTLPIGAMRRRRLVDVHDSGTAWDVNAMFRDTHVDHDGRETVLHEYTLTAAVDVASGTFTSCRAVPRVLPWVECPVAAASADRLVGRTPDEVRDFVRAELRGTTTCTHLNDLLRSLGDVGQLAAALRRAT